MTKVSKMSLITELKVLLAKHDMPMNRFVINSDLVYKDGCSPVITSCKTPALQDMVSNFDHYYQQSLIARDRIGVHPKLTQLRAKCRENYCNELYRYDNGAALAQRFGLDKRNIYIGTIEGVIQNVEWYLEFIPELYRYDLVSESVVFDITDPDGLFRAKQALIGRIKEECKHRADVTNVNGQVYVFQEKLFTLLPNSTMVKSKGCRVNIDILLNICFWLGLPVELKYHSFPLDPKGDKELKELLVTKSEVQDYFTTLLKQRGTSIYQLVVNSDLAKNPNAILTLGSINKDFIKYILDNFEHYYQQSLTPRKKLPTHQKLTRLRLELLHTFKGLFINPEIRSDLFNRMNALGIYPQERYRKNKSAMVRWYTNIPTSFIKLRCTVGDHSFILNDPDECSAAKETLLVEFVDKIAKIGTVIQRRLFIINDCYVVLPHHVGECSVRVDEVTLDLVLNLAFWLDYDVTIEQCD